MTRRRDVFCARVGADARERALLVPRFWLRAAARTNPESERAGGTLRARAGERERYQRQCRTAPDLI